VFTIKWKAVHVAVESVFTIPWKLCSPSRGIRILDEGEIDLADQPEVETCLRLITIAKYDAEDDQFVAKTVYGRPDEAEDDRKAIIYGAAPDWSFGFDVFG
jgi:hypothetical protein